MANSFVTYQGLGAVANSCLDGLENNMAVASRVTRDWDDQFGTRKRKIGDTFYIRKEPRYAVQTNADISAADLSYTDPTPVALTLSQRIVIPISIPSQDYLLKFDEAERRFFQPASKKMANHLDRYCIETMTTGAGNTVGAGGTLTDSVVHSMYAPLPGTQLTASSTTRATKAFNAARAKIAALGMNTDDLVAAIDPILDVEFREQLLQGATATATAFNDSAIGKMYRKGRITTVGGIEYALDQNIMAKTIGTFDSANALVNVAGGVLNGATSVVTDNWGGTTNLKAGDPIQFGGTSNASGGAFAVNPLSLQSIGELMQFVVTSDATAAAGAMTINFAPAVYGSGSVLQNVVGPGTGISGSPVIADNARIYVYGVHSATNASGKSPYLDLVFAPEAFGLACVQLPEYEGVWKSASAVNDETGLAIRVAQFVDGYKDNFVMRLDGLFGGAVLYTEGICRVQTT